MFESICGGRPFTGSQASRWLVNTKAADEMSITSGNLRARPTSSSSSKLAKECFRRRSERRRVLTGQRNGKIDGFDLPGTNECPVNNSENLRYLERSEISVSKLCSLEYFGSLCEREDECS